MAHILVADDDAAVRSAIRKLLEAVGHDVEEASEGSEVLRLHREHPSDLLLIDLYMPGMDGLETIIRLKAEQPDTMIVALSGGGYRDKHDVLATAIKAGACGTLAKPFERTDLLAAISAALGAEQARQAGGGGQSAGIENSPEGSEKDSSAKATVLLVDDNEQARLVLRRRLESAGYRVIEASDAETALQMFRANSADVVVTDLILPGESGEDLIADLQREFGAVRVIAISGAPERLATLTTDSTLIRCLAKPFTTPQLLEAIEAVLPRNRQPRSLISRLWELLRFPRLRRHLPRSGSS